MSGVFKMKSNKLGDENGARDITTMSSNRTVIHSNETDVVILALCYCAKSTSLTDVWVRRDSVTLIPINDTVRSLGKGKI